MCKSKQDGGQRCYSHASKRVTARERAFAKSGTGEALSALVNAHIDLASTPEGHAFAEYAVQQGRPAPGGLPPEMWSRIAEQGAALRERNALLAGVASASLERRDAAAVRSLAALNPALATPSTLTCQVRDWYPEEADPAVIDDLRQADFRIVSVDLETTGFDPATGAQVTEVSWYCLNTGDGGTFIPQHTLEGADPVSLEISRYDERIKGQPMDDTGQVGALRSLLGGDGTKTYLVGSNPGFDALHLNALCAKEGVGAPKFNHRKIDSAQGAYWQDPDAPFGVPTGLKEASAMTGVELDGHHDAWVDTTAAARLWHVLEKTRRSLPRRA